MNPTKIFDEVLDYAQGFYQEKRTHVLNELVATLMIYQSSTDSITDLLDSFGFDSTSFSAVGAASIYLSNKNIILLPRASKEVLFELIAHEVFGHAIGNVFDSSKDDDKRKSGFTSYDKELKCYTDFYLSEGYALYIQKKITSIADCHCSLSDTYYRDTHSNGLKFFETIFDEMPEVGEEVIDSYIYKDKSLLEVFSGDSQLPFKQIRDTFNKYSYTGSPKIMKKEDHLQINEGIKELRKVYIKKKK